MLHLAHGWSNNRRSFDVPAQSQLWLYIATTTIAVSNDISVSVTTRPKRMLGTLICSMGLVLTCLLAAHPIAFVKYISFVLDFACFPLLGIYLTLEVVKGPLDELADPYLLMRCVEACRCCSRPEFMPPAADRSVADRYPRDWSLFRSPSDTTLQS